jgi:branched-chain amino acid transport system permease protein
MTAPDPHALVQAVASGLLLGGLFGLAALGLSLVLGVMRLVNLVHGELVVLGSYASFLLLDRAGLDPLLSLPVVALMVGGLAYPVQRLLLQPLTGAGDEAPLISTFALSIIVQNLLIVFLTADTRTIDRSYTRGRLTVAGITVPYIYLIGCAVSVVIVAAVHLLTNRSAFGRRLRASAEDPEAAAVVGVPVRSIHARTYALGGAVAGVAGALLGMAFSFTPTTGTDYLLTGFAVVVLGGLGSVLGTLAGGLALGVIESVGAVILGDGYRVFVGLVVFLIFLAARPQGLFGRTAS